MASELLTAGKFLAPHAANLASRSTFALTLRLAWRIRAACSFPVPLRRLRALLAEPHVLELMACADEAQAKALVDTVARRFQTARPWRAWDEAYRRGRAEKVAQLAQRELLRVTGVKDGIAVLDQRAQGRQDELLSGQTQLGHKVVEVAERHDAKFAQLEGLISRSETSDAQMLEQLPPRLRDLASKAVVADPSSRYLLESWGDTAERGGIFAVWTAEPPAWLAQAGTSTWLLLAEMCATAHLHDAFRTAVGEALSRGATPRAYWTTRLAHTWAGDDKGQALSVLDAEQTTQPGSYPYSDFLRGVLAGDEAAHRQLDGWEPDDPVARGLRDQWVSSYLASDDVDGAIAYLEQRGARQTGDGTTQQLAQWYLRRAQLRLGISRDADARQAQELALQVRNHRRAFLMDSSHAVLLAADALILLHDWPGVWSLVMSPPEGEASPEEAAHPEVLGRAAMAATVTGRHDRARDLAAASGEFERLWLEATLEQEDAPADQETRQGNIRRWEAAWAAATTESQRVNAARGLLLAGKVDFSGLDELRERQPLAINGVERLARVLVETGDQSAARVTRLRALSVEIEEAAVELGQSLFSQGDIEGGIHVLVQAASRFEHEQLRLMAANAAGAAKDWDRLRSLSNDALLRAGPDWPGRHVAIRNLYSVAQVRGEWADAANHAKTLLGELPHDEGARWALVVALYHLGDFSDAWKLIEKAQLLPDAADPQVALIYLDLTARFSSPESTWREVVRFLGVRKHEESFAAQALGIAYRASARHSPANESEEIEEGLNKTASPELHALHEATEEFFEQFPESQYFQRLQFDNITDLIEQLKAVFRPAAAVREKFARDISGGSLPVGAACMLGVGSYSEAVLVTARDMLLVQSSLTDEQQSHREAARVALSSNMPVVMDIAALHLAVAISHRFVDAPLASPLANQFSETLVHSFQDLRVTYSSLHDLIKARDAVDLASLMRANYDPAHDRIYFVEDDQQLRQETKRRLGGMYALAESLPKLADIPEGERELQGPNFDPWLGSATTAKAIGGSLWSDDLALRRLAAAMSVPAFGTLDLVAALLATEAIEDSTSVEVQFHARALRCADLPVELQTMRVIAEAEGWKPGSAAMPLSRPLSWRRTRECLALLREGVEHAASEKEQVIGWFGSALYGLKPITEEGNSEVVERIIARMLVEDWITPICVDGIVTSLKQLHPDLAPEMWSHALTFAVGALTTIYGEAKSVQVLLQLCSELADGERVTAAQALLARDRVQPEG